MTPNVVAASRRRGFTKVRAERQGVSIKHFITADYLSVLTYGVRFGAISKNCFDHSCLAFVCIESRCKNINFF